MNHSFIRYAYSKPVIIQHATDNTVSIFTSQFVFYFGFCNYDLFNRELMFWNLFNNDRFTSPYLRSLPSSTNHCSMCCQSSFATLYEVTNHITVMLYTLFCLGSLYTNLCALTVQLGRVVQDNHTCLVHKHEFKPEESIV